MADDKGNRQVLPEFAEKHKDGYYDKKGHWVRTVHCYMDCGARCTCRPPNGINFIGANDD